MRCAADKEMSQLQQDDANQADGLQAYRDVSSLAAVVWRI